MNIKYTIDNIKNMYKVFINVITETLVYYIEVEKQITQLTCVNREFINKTNLLSNRLYEFPIKLQKYVAWRAYRLALHGYTYEVILNEITFMKNILLKRR